MMKDMWFLHPHLDYLPSISHHTLPLADNTISAGAYTWPNLTKYSWYITFIQDNIVLTATVGDGGFLWIFKSTCWGFVFRCNFVHSLVSSIPGPKGSSAQNQSKMDSWLLATFVKLSLTSPPLAHFWAPEVDLKKRPVRVPEMTDLASSLSSITGTMKQTFKLFYPFLLRAHHLLASSEEGCNWRRLCQRRCSQGLRS